MNTMSATTRSSPKPNNSFDSVLAADTKTLHCAAFGANFCLPCLPTDAKSKTICRENENLVSKLSLRHRDARSDHLAVRAAPSVQLRDDVVADRSDVDDDMDDPAYERRWKEELAWLRRQDARRQDDPEDVEDEHLDTIGSPNFSSPALQLVWGRFMSHHQRISQRQNMTILRRAALITFGPSYGRGTAHAIGLWANSDDTSIFFNFGCWIRQQREIWFRLLFGSWTTI
jgi:hypothetical protein